MAFAEFLSAPAGARPMTLESPGYDELQQAHHNLRVVRAEAFLVEIDNAVQSMAVFAERPCPTRLNYALSQEVVVQWSGEVLEERPIWRE